MIRALFDISFDIIIYWAVVNLIFLFIFHVEDMYCVYYILNVNLKFQVINKILFGWITILYKVFKLDK